VVGVHDVIEAEGVVAYAMEWIPGGSLARLIGSWRVLAGEDELETLSEEFGFVRGALGPSSVVTWIVQAFARLARALSDVHRAGLLHRDIKPANLLVGRGGELLLSDFGLVRDQELSQHTRTGAVLGTLAYSSPEQLRGEHERVDARSDLYSLGVSLFEALTLALPFPATSPAERQRQAELGVFARPRRRGVRLPRDLETILAKLLEPEPARRYASGDGLAEDLEALLALRPIRARPAGLATRFWKAARRNRRTLLATVAGTVGAIALSLAGGFWLWRTPRAIEARVLEARLLLLETERIDAFSPIDWKDTQAAEKPILSTEGWPETLTQAAELYERALALDPLDLLGHGDRLARERDVLRLALFHATGKGDGTSLTARLTAYPLTARIAGTWTASARSKPTMEELRTASEADRHLLGLLGYFLGDFVLAAEAWNSRPLDAEPDVLADGALGVLHLYARRFDLAHHRLAEARRLAPRSDFLCGELAFCAAKLGQVEEAARLLAEAESLARNDRYEIIERAHASLLMASGKVNDAYLYYQGHKDHSGPRFTEEYADVLQAAGKFGEEVERRSANVFYRPAVVRYRKEALDAVERWWASLGEAGRRHTLERVVAGDRGGLASPSTHLGGTSLPEVVLEFRDKFETMPATRPEDSEPPRVWTTSVLDQDGRPVRPSFLRVAEDFVTAGVTDEEWSRFPPGIRTRLVDLWLSPLPVVPRRFACRALVQEGLLEARR
jgi:tetratricopeptide (TPR) repeat protein